MTKLQLTLTDQEADLLSLRAAQFGYNLTRFIKFLISKTVASVIEEREIPTFLMSKKAERIAIKARKDYEKKRAEEVVSFKNLAKSK